MLVNGTLLGFRVAIWLLHGRGSTKASSALTDEKLQALHTDRLAHTLDTLVGTAGAFRV